MRFDLGFPKCSKLQTLSTIPWFLLGLWLIEFKVLGFKVLRTASTNELNMG